MPLFGILSAVLEFEIPVFLTPHSDNSAARADCFRRLLTFFTQHLFKLLSRSDL